VLQCIKTEALKTAIQKKNIDKLFASDYGIFKTAELPIIQSQKNNIPYTAFFNRWYLELYKKNITCRIVHFMIKDIKTFYVFNAQDLQNQ